MSADYHPRMCLSLTRVVKRNKSKDDDGFLLSLKIGDLDIPIIP